MPDMSIWVAYDAGQYSDRNRTINAVDGLVNQINNRTQHTAVRIGVVGVPSNYLYDSRPDTNKYSQQIFRNAADYIEEVNSGTYMQDHDHLLVGRTDASLGWGDGGYSYTMPDGDSVYGGNHLITFGGYYPARNIGMHELLHPRPIFAKHEDGSVGLDASFQIDEVSPMATSYTMDTNGKCDTEVCGGSTFFPSCGSASHPSSLCNRKNGEFEFDTNCPIHVKTLSDCTIDKINARLGGFSMR